MPRTVNGTGHRGHTALDVLKGWRVVKKGILPGQCTSDARHKGSPGPVRARIVFARRAPARDS